MNKFQYNGRTYYYDSNSNFIMEIGRYENKYKTYKTFNDVNEALLAYDDFSVANGYKKRLKLFVRPDDLPYIICKQISKKETTCES